MIMSFLVLISTHGTGTGMCVAFIYIWIKCMVCIASLKFGVANRANVPMLFTVI